MAKTRDFRRLLRAGIALLILLLPAAITVLGEEQAAKPSVGRLVLEGKGIGKLVLEKRRSEPYLPDSEQVFSSPTRILEIPVGEYRVKRADLGEGVSYNPPDAIADAKSGKRQEFGWFVLTPERPYVLRVGGPLKPSLTVVREGRVIRMSHRLASQYDENDQPFPFYFCDNRDNPPRFTVCCNGRVIGSGVLGPYG